MNKNIEEILLKSKSRSDASFKIFGYNNTNTLKKVDEYIKELNYVFVKQTSNCLFCNKEIKNYKKFCNSSCSASHNNKNRKCSESTKIKISNTLKSRTNKNIHKIESICSNCGKEFIQKKKEKCCSKECVHDRILFGSIIGGRKSVLSQNKRSKNENYFSELCINEYDNVKLNEQLFNGWDADIILNDYKLAILWNGNWHHKKLGENHSLSQVQNRDKIKIKEILKFGYLPYIIDDYGKYNKILVEEEFEKLKQYIKLKTTK